MLFTITSLGNWMKGCVVVVALLECCQSKLKLLARFPKEDKARIPFAFRRTQCLSYMWRPSMANICCSQFLLLGSGRKTWSMVDIFALLECCQSKVKLLACFPKEENARIPLAFKTYAMFAPTQRKRENIKLPQLNL